MEILIAGKIISKQGGYTVHMEVCAADKTLHQLTAKVKALHEVPAIIKTWLSTLQ